MTKRLRRWKFIGGLRRTMFPFPRLVGDLAIPVDHASRLCMQKRTLSECCAGLVQYYARVERGGLRWSRGESPPIDRPSYIARDNPTSMLMTCMD